MTDFDPSLPALTLGDGSRVGLAEPPMTSQRLRLERRRGRVTLASAALPYPAAGLGGGRFVASPSGRWLLFSYHSGQTEEGFVVLEAEDLRVHVAQPYLPGVTATFGFDEAERALVMAAPLDASEWWWPWTEGETAPEPPGRRAAPVARLVHVDLSDGSRHEVTVVAHAAENWIPRGSDFDPTLRPRLSARSLALSFPWGEEHVPLPLADVVRIAIPSSA